MRFIYSVKDVLSGFVSVPGVPLLLDLPNDDCARRLVQDCCANGAQPNVFNVHPEHKELWRVAKFDQESGVVTSLIPECIARAIDFIGLESAKEVPADVKDCSQDKNTEVA